MCGREPNFELPEEEKHELRKFSWDEFLAATRSTITNKSKQAFVFLEILFHQVLLRLLNVQKARNEAVGLVRAENFRTTIGRAIKVRLLKMIQPHDR